MLFQDLVQIFRHLLVILSEKVSKKIFGQKVYLA